MDLQVNPEVVIADLLEQIKKLTLDNSILRALIKQQANADQTETVD